MKQNVSRYFFLNENPWKFGPYILLPITSVILYHLICTSSSAYPGLQSTIFYLMGQLIRQLRILTFILLHLDELAMEITGNDRERWQQFCTTMLAEVIDHHAVIKRLERFSWLRLGANGPPTTATMTNEFSPQCYRSGETSISSNQKVIKKWHRQIS